MEPRDTLSRIISSFLLLDVGLLALGCDAVVLLHVPGEGPAVARHVRTPLGGASVVSGQVSLRVPPHGLLLQFGGKEQTCAPRMTNNCGTHVYGPVVADLAGDDVSPPVVQPVHCDLVAPEGGRVGHLEPALVALVQLLLVLGAVDGANVSGQEPGRIRRKTRCIETAGSC